jgi:hypothetical protein
VVPQSPSEVPPDRRDSEAEEETLVDLMTLGFERLFQHLRRVPVFPEVEAAVAALRRAIRLDVAAWSRGLMGAVRFARGMAAVMSGAVVALRSVRRLTRSSTRRT